MDVEVKWEKSAEQIVKERTGENDGQLFLANEAKRLMDPYVPADSMVLAQNVRVYVDGDKGVVEYQSPYAHYQYEGVAYGPNYPIMDGTVMGFYSPPHKSSTGKKLKYSHFGIRRPLRSGTKQSRQGMNDSWNVGDGGLSER
ncbi:MAG: minor capsid protein [Lachnospiraceae bacterium]